MHIDDLLPAFPIVYFEQLPKDFFFGKRKDSKYIFHIDELKEILAHLVHDYAMVSHHDHLVSTYDTRYLDSDDLKHYHDHHHGKMNRIKYRIRTYEDGISYFEVKGKRNTGYTMKSRWEFDQSGKEYADPLQQIAAWESLKENGYKEQLHIRYDRITLYSKDFQEKITFDTQMHIEKDGQKWSSDTLVIAESKMAEHRVSVFRELMKVLHIRETSFSKYCFGIAKLVPSIKRNNFKQLLRKTEKIISKYEITSGNI